MIKHLTRVLATIAVAFGGLALATPSADAYVHVAGCQASLLGQSGNDNDVATYGAAHGLIFWKWTGDDQHYGDFKVETQVYYHDAFGGVFATQGLCYGDDDTHMHNDVVSDWPFPPWF